MHELTVLRDLVLLVAVAVPTVLLAQRLRVPNIVGFLATGVLIGPHALRLIRDVDAISALAELGVVLLLFAIGLELSLSRILRMGRDMLIGGGLQIGGTMVAVGAVALAFSVPLTQAVTYGALAALSSTAVVLKIYADRGELDSPHGRVVVAILLFQDLCIVPLMLLFRLLGGAETGVWEAGREVGISLAVVGTLVLGGRVAVPWVLERLVDVKNRELFTMAIVFIGLGAAYLTASFGLSLALGAFLAGLVISESEFGLQALSDILPFRDTFSGIFFTSVGMLLDIRYLIAETGPVLAIALGLVVIKTLSGTFAARAINRTLQVSIVAGLGLAQVGEFSFVLAGVAHPLGLISDQAFQVFLGASVLSILLAPLAIAGARPVADIICRVARQPTTELMAAGEQEAEALSDHVIIVGYGVSGRNLARVLDGAGIPYVILEQNGNIVRQARRELQPILFGDATRVEVLHRVGIERARAMVVAISSPADEHRAVALARQLNPSLRIIVRTLRVDNVDELERAGADDVIAQEFETSLEIFARVLHHYGIPSNTIDREIHAAREEQYGIVRGRTAPELQLDALAHLGVHHALDILEVEDGAPAVGGSPVSLELRKQTGATVVAVVRDGTPYHAPDPAFRFAPGDSVVLVGDDEALARARALFVRPGRDVQPPSAIRTVSK